MKGRLRSGGLSDAQAVALSNVSLVSGYGNLSEKAIRKILPHLEKGLGYSDAVIAAGYSHHSDFRDGEAHGRLPYYGEVLTRTRLARTRRKTLRFTANRRDMGASPIRPCISGWGN